MKEWPRIVLALWALVALGVVAHQALQLHRETTGAGRADEGQQAAIEADENGALSEEPIPQSVPALLEAIRAGEVPSGEAAFDLRSFGPGAAPLLIAALK